MVEQGISLHAQQRPYMYNPVQLQSGIVSGHGHAPSLPAHFFQTLLHSVGSSTHQPLEMIQRGVELPHCPSRVNLTARS